MSSKSKPRDRDRDRDREDEGSRHGSSSGRPRDGPRDGSRDGRDSREQRPSWREADRQGDGGRDSRPGSGQQAGSKPSGGGSRPGAPAASRPTGPLLGSSVISNAILEAAKRRAQEHAAAAPDAADEDAQAAGGGPRKRPKHDPIIWSSPKREAADEPGRSSSQPESAADRLHREAAEFKQLQQQLVAADGGGRGRSSSRSRTPERPPSQQQRRHHGRSRSSSSSRSSSPHEHRRPRGRWQEEEEEEQPQKQQPQQPGKSRWVEEEPAADEVEEGEAPAGDLGTVGAALDEELEALNRRERAELEAGSSDDGGGGGGLGGVPGPHSSDDEGEQAGQAQAPAQKNMLEESRRVEEYERLNRISEGTYGVVHRARCKATGKIFALKKLKLEACGDGFPQTSVREMNVLLSLHHPNIVNVSEIVIGGRDNIYMVMEYVEHDLKYVLELQNAKKAPPFSIGQVKFLMKQLLEGVAYLHHNWVLHRDLKTSNLLYSNNGELKICDFGLARQYGDPLRPYTPMVVTLWYRSIERLLNDTHYATALDMWSVGCIMGELILGEPLFQGRGELDQIKQIFALLGTPTQESWPGWDKIGDNKNMQWKPQESKLRKKFPTTFFGGSKPVLNDTGFDLLSRLLEMNPERRISAADALAHPWFSEAPRPVTAALMPGFPARHQQGKEAFRDKMGKPSPGAVGVVGFGI